MLELLKFTPHKKYNTIKYHHFRIKVKMAYNPLGDILIKYISMKKQQADIFINPVDNATFFTLNHLLCGW